MLAMLAMLARPARVPRRNSPASRCVARVAQDSLSKCPNTPNTLNAPLSRKLFLCGKGRGGGWSISHKSICLCSSFLQILFPKAVHLEYLGYVGRDSYRRAPLRRMTRSPPTGATHATCPPCSPQPARLLASPRQPACSACSTRLLRQPACQHAPPAPPAPPRRHHATSIEEIRSAGRRVRRHAQQPGARLLSRVTALRDQHVLQRVRAVHAPPVRRELGQQAPIEPRRQLERARVRRRGARGIGVRQFILRIEFLEWRGALGIPSGGYMRVHAEYTMYSCGLGG